MKQVCIEGPLDAGKWTECVQAGFHSIGLSSAVHYHDCMDTLSRISDRLHNGFRSRGLPGIFVSWRQMSGHRLQSIVRRNKSLILMSLHSEMTGRDVEELRDVNPQMKIIYWWGSPIRGEEQIARLLELDSLVDALALPYWGDLEKLYGQGAGKAHFVPFAACPYNHQVTLTPKLQRKWGREVIVVGVHDEYLENLVCKVGEALKRPVDVWGPGWSNSQWVRANGFIEHPKSLYAYAASTIVINSHGPAHAQHNGLNPRFYEIAATGGFQLVEEQPALREHPMRYQIATFKNPEDLVEKIRYFVQESETRETMRTILQSHVLQHETYGHRLFSLLQSMGYRE